MPEIVKRGFVSTDVKEFNTESIKILKIAQRDICTFINRNYDINKVTEFVGNHFKLSSRQRLALKRACSSDIDLQIRNEKRIDNINENSIINIDGLNIIITLEVALSNTTILKCMDGTIRDLAGLRGTYKIIDKTEIALNLIRSDTYTHDESII